MPSSVVMVLPSTTAPAWRKASTLAESARVWFPSNSLLPIWVGMSLVCSRSLMPTGMPSMEESGRPAR